ncbi:MAG: hypothetical protein R3Y18_00100 [Bacillota bacterium]
MKTVLFHSLNFRSADETIEDILIDVKKKIGKDMTKAQWKQFRDTVFKQKDYRSKLATIRCYVNLVDINGQE